MLRKQVWKLVTNPNSLVAKVLKAKYYPKESIFKCKVPWNASWIWQSLVGVSEMVERRTMRKLGNGKSKTVWKGNWIPKNPQGKSISVKPHECIIQKVEDLIHNFRWKKPLNFKLFKEEEVKRIFFAVQRKWLVNSRFCI